MNADDVRRTAAECTNFLSATLSRDWTAGIPDLDWSVVEVVGHVAEVCLWYAVDVSAQGKDLATVEQRVKTDGGPRGVLDTLAAHASLLAAVIEAAPDGLRAFHPFGQADVSGFAAMACDELLIHTDDAARGLAVDFQPSDELIEPVLERLFPWGTPEGTAWERLRWANGRLGLGDQPRLHRWRWHCAPLEEWDGTDPHADQLV